MGRPTDKLVIPPAERAKIVGWVLRAAQAEGRYPRFGRGRPPSIGHDFIEEKTGIDADTANGWLRAGSRAKGAPLEGLQRLRDWLDGERRYLAQNHDPTNLQVNWADLESRYPRFVRLAEKADASYVWGRIDHMHNELTPDDRLNELADLADELELVTGATEFRGRVRQAEWERIQAHVSFAVIHSALALGRLRPGASIRNYLARGRFAAELAFGVRSALEHLVGFEILSAMLTARNNVEQTVDAGLIARLRSVGPSLLGDRWKPRALEIGAREARDPKLPIVVRIGMLARARDSLEDLGHSFGAATTSLAIAVMAVELNDVEKAYRELERAEGAGLQLTELNSIRLANTRLLVQAAAGEPDPSRAQATFERASQAGLHHQGARAKALASDRLTPATARRLAQMFSRQ